MFPMKREAIDNTQNLDLNTTARKNEKTIEKFSPYLINATYCVLQANLAYPIGSFNLEREMAALAEKNLAMQSSTNLSVNEEAKVSQQTNRPKTSATVSVNDPNGAIFERMIIILPYKSANEVKQI